MKRPASPLETLDKDDRSCVVSGGGLSRNVRTELIALASGKGQQILVRGSGLCLCGAQNCSFWIYQKTAKKYELLLKGVGSTIVRRGRSSSKGYHDVVSESHASAIETVVRTYRFDGKLYQLSRCVRRQYFDDNGNPTKAPADRPCD